MSAPRHSRRRPDEAAEMTEVGGSTNAAAPDRKTRARSESRRVRVADPARPRASLRDARRTACPQNFTGLLRLSPLLRFSVFCRFLRMLRRLCAQRERRDFAAFAVFGFDRDQAVLARGRRSLREYSCSLRASVVACVLGWNSGISALSAFRVAWALPALTARARARNPVRTAPAECGA